MTEERSKTGTPSSTGELFEEYVRKIIESHNAVAAGRLVDYLRFKFHMTHQEIYERVNAAHPITMAAWDTLLEEADWEEGNG